MISTRDLRGVFILQMRELVLTKLYRLSLCLVHFRNGIWTLDLWLLKPGLFPLGPHPFGRILTAGENPPPWPQMLKFCKLWGNKDSRYHHHCLPPSPSRYWFPGTMPVSTWPTPLGTQTVHFSRAGEVVSGLHREQGPSPKSNKIKSKRLYILWICFWPLSVSRALGHPGLYCKRSPFA